MAKTLVHLDNQTQGSLPYSKMTISANDLSISQISGLQTELDNLSGSVSTFEWQESVLSATVLNPVALTPSVGDRYLIAGTGAGDWLNKNNQIATCTNATGPVWEYFTPTGAGVFVASDAEANRLYYWGGSSWAAKEFEQTVADEVTLEKTGFSLHIKNGGVASTQLATAVNTNIGLGVTANGWGDHSGLYLPLGGGTLSGDLALGANDITMTGSLGLTGSRLTKGWFTDLEVTNAIAGSVTGSAASFTGSLGGDVTGTQASTAIAASVVTGKLITGFSSGAGVVAASDTVLQAINKLDGNVGTKLASSAFTDAAVTSKLITGFVSGAGVVAASDTILQAVNKLDGNVATKLASSAFTDAAVTSKLITGFVSGAGTVAASDTILQAVNKLDGNVALTLKTSASSALLTGNTLNINSGATLSIDGNWDIGGTGVTATAAQLNALGTIERESTTGTAMGGTTFTLAHTPKSKSENVYLNGILQLGGGEDYTLTGAAVIFTFTPAAADRVVVAYHW